MGLGIRLMPGLRLSAAPRGLRAEAGPRASRNGSTAATAVAGPVARQLAAGEPPAGHASVGAQCEALVRTEERLRGAHAEPVAAAGEPRLAPAVAIDEPSVLAQHERDALDGLSVLSRGARRDARALASRRAAATIAALRERDEAERYERLRAEKAAWEGLRSNDPAAVLTALDASFEAALAPVARWIASDRARRLCSCSARSTSCRGCDRG